MKPDKKTKLLGEVVDALYKTFAERQKEPHQYVVEYRRVKDDSLIGYHASTFCQVTQNRLGAKRYSGKNPYKQLEIIRDNLKSLLETSDDSKRLFSKITLSIKHNDFDCAKIDEVYLQADYLEEGVSKQKLDINLKL